MDLPGRTKRPVYWTEQEETPIRRCSWFYKSNVDGRWSPYSEAVSSSLEAEYRSAVASGQWSRRLDLADGGIDAEETEALGGAGSHVMLHSPNVMMHFSGSATGGLTGAYGAGVGGAAGAPGAPGATGMSVFQGAGNLDDWGQVQPQVREEK